MIQLIGCVEWLHLASVLVREQKHEAVLVQLQIKDAQISCRRNHITVEIIFHSVQRIQIHTRTPTIMKKPLLILHSSVTEAVLRLFGLHTVLLDRQIQFHKPLHLAFDRGKLLIINRIIFQFAVISLAERIEHAHMNRISPQIINRFLKKQCHTAPVGSLSVPLRHVKERHDRTVCHFLI